MDRIANSRIGMISKMVSEELECEEADNVFEALRVAGLNPVMSTNHQKTHIIKDTETGEAIAKSCGKYRRMIIKSSFVYRKRNKDGMDSKCNECVREYKREKNKQLKDGY